VRVNDVVGVAGFALPGNFVDILVNMQASASGSEHAISRIVLERILVLAVAQEVGRDETRPKVVNAVTLEVTPAQAESIDLARSVGSLSLVLRNQVDPLPGVTTGATRTPCCISRRHLCRPILYRRHGRQRCLLSLGVTA
jgi:pilus assembly protein CpaB